MRAQVGDELTVKGRHQGDEERHGAALPVPDLVEEMVSRALEDGGQVLVVHDAPGRVAARLHCPVAQ